MVYVKCKVYKRGHFYICLCNFSSTYKDKFRRRELCIIFNNKKIFDKDNKAQIKS